MRILMLSLLVSSILTASCQSVMHASSWPVMPSSDSSLGYFEAQVNPALLGLRRAACVGISSEKPFMLPGILAGGGFQTRAARWGIGIHGHWEQFGAWRLWRVEGLLGRQLNTRLSVGAALFLQQQRAVPLDPSISYGMRLGLQYQPNTVWSWSAVLSQRRSIVAKELRSIQTEWLLAAQARISSLIALEAQVLERGFHSIQSAGWMQFFPSNRLHISGGIEWPARAFSLLARIRQRYGVLTLRIRHQSWIGVTPGTRLDIHPPINRP